LTTLPAGTIVRVLDIKDEWMNVEFRDERFGPRVGYVLKTHVKVEESTADRDQAQRLAAARLAAAKSADGASARSSGVRDSAANCRRIDCIPPTVLMNARPPLLVNPQSSTTVQR
jgi:hypothetical protein